MKKQFLFISLFVLVFFTVQADSLWKSYSERIYQPGGRIIGKGDMITIYVSESTSAVQQASTSTGKNTSIGTSLSNNWDKVTSALGNDRNRVNQELGITGSDSYQGTGQTQRRSSVRAIVTAVVTDILKNGNLFVVGEHKVKVNQDIETIRISGIIRPEDITRKNSVFSWQIAKAEVSVSGSGGPIATKQNPGVVGKLVNWIF